MPGRAPSRGAAKSRGATARARASKAGNPPSSVVDSLAESSARIVRQAATVLEEEFAASVAVARTTEARIRESRSRRRTGTQLKEFRRSGHELIELLARAAETVLEAAEKVDRSATTGASRGRGRAR